MKVKLNREELNLPEIMEIRELTNDFSKNAFTTKTLSLPMACHSLINEILRRNTLCTKKLNYILKRTKIVKQHFKVKKSSEGMSYYYYSNKIKNVIESSEFFQKLLQKQQLQEILIRETNE